MPTETPHYNGRPKLLLVDDDESARLTLAMALTRQGFAVSTAEDGIAALALLAENGFDWVISDLRMPGMTGIELASHLQLQHPGVRCILVSAFAMADELTELGVVACLEKPVDAEQLFALLSCNGNSAADASLRQP